MDEKWQKEKKPDQCMAWGCSKKKTFRCSACSQRWYCSRSCQRDDWIHVHKGQCPKLKAMKEKREADAKKEVKLEHIRVRKKVKGAALERQSAAIRDLTFSEKVDYVVFGDGTRPDVKLSFPNMAGKVQLRMLRLKAADGHFCYLKMLHKLLIDHAPQLTKRIRDQLQAEYDMDPMSPIVQTAKDDNEYDWPTDYETNRVFASLGIGSIDDQLIQAGTQERLDQARREFGGMSFEEYVDTVIQPDGHDPYDPENWAPEDDYDPANWVPNPATWAAREAPSPHSLHGRASSSSKDQYPPCSSSSSKDQDTAATVVDDDGALGHEERKGEEPELARYGTDRTRPRPQGLSAGDVRLVMTNPPI